MKLPASRLTDASEIISPSVTLGVEGITLKNDSTLLKLLSFLLAGSENDRDILLGVPLLCIKN